MPLIASLILAAGSVIHAGTIQPAGTPPTSRGSALTDISVDDALNFKSDTLIPDWATKPKDRNAALGYLSADTNLPRQLGQAIQDIDWDKVPTSAGGEIPESFAKAAKVYADGCAAAVETALLASTRDRCDFELEYEGGVAMLMPHLGRMRHLTRTLRFDARQELIAGRPAKAAARVGAMFRMAAHVSNDRILISTLVSNAISAMATQEAEVLVASGSLGADDAASLRAAIARVRTEDPFQGRAALTTERDLFLRWLRLAMNRGEHAAQAVVGMLGNADHPEIARELRDLSAEALEREIARAQEGYDEVLAAWGTVDSAAKLQVINARVEKGDFGIIARLAMPSFQKAWTNVEKQLKDLAELDRKLAAIGK